eukprot:2738367-Amphidinium_carterae.1
MVNHMGSLRKLNTGVQSFPGQLIHAGSVPGSPSQTSLKTMKQGNALFSSIPGLRIRGPAGLAVRGLKRTFSPIYP